MFTSIHRRIICASWVIMGMSLCFGSAPAGAAEAPSLPWTGLVPTPGQTISLTAEAHEIDSGLAIELPDSQPKGSSIQITASDMVTANYHWHTTTLPGETKGDNAQDKLRDALLSIRIRGFSGNFTRLLFIRPDLHFYDAADLPAALKAWQAYPPATTHVFTLQISGLMDRLEITIDGRYLTHIPRAEAGRQLRLVAIKAGTLNSLATGQNVESALLLPVDISYTYSQDGAVLSNLSLTASGQAAVAQAGITPVPLNRHIDVGKSRWLRQALDSSSFYHPYYKRSAWDNVPESILLSVPRRHYLGAHILYALRTDQGRQPSMTLRLARYRQSWDGTGGTQADSSVNLDPRHPAGATDIQAVGSLQAIIDGHPQTLTTYLATIPLHTGELADVFAMTGLDGKEPTDFFYLEFSRALGVRATVNNGIHDWAPVGPRSGVIVLGVSLQKPPVNLLVQSPVPGFVFYRDQSPRLRVVASDPGLETTPWTGPVRMSAHLHDFDGRPHELTTALDVKTGTAAQDIPLNHLHPGWYEGDFTFENTAHQLLWRQRVAFALLPADTRKATYDQSPYGVWWFGGSHYTQKDATIALPLIHKMGFRRTTPSDNSRQIEAFAANDVYPGMMRYIKRPGKQGVAQQAREYLEKFPQVKWAMIFHETTGTTDNIGLPPELLDKPVEPRTDKQQAAYEKLRDAALAYVKEVRSVAPNMKFILGNGTTNFNIGWMRDKFPREDWDALGMEVAVQTTHPEGPPTGWNLQSYYLATTVGHKLGYDNLPITACFEVDYRGTLPGALSRSTQANWYARDVLLSLAYRLPTIYVGLLEDTNSSYYTSRWGAAGVMERAPLMMPKPSYVALATLTQVLDLAKYQRFIPTGSTVTQCLEFKQDDHYVYAIWASDGRRPVQLHFKQPVQNITLVHSAGYRQQLPASQSIMANESPVYVISPTVVEHITLGPSENKTPVLNNPKTIASLSPAKWHVVKEPSAVLEPAAAYSPITQGQIIIDSASRDILKLVMTPKPDTPDLVAQYVTLEPDEGPIVITGQPDTLGVWVNGHGDWGRIYFEIIDAKGRHWVSNSWKEGEGQWDMSDWQARTSFNFDGWKLITQPLPLLYPSGYYGPYFRDWQCVGDNSKYNGIVYPIKLARIHVLMRPRLVQVTDMVDATSLTLELRDAGAGDSGEALIMQQPFP